MKKLFLLFVFLFFVSPSLVKAGCYLNGAPGFTTCNAAMAPHICISGSVQYACCDTFAETCPAAPVTPGPSTPIPTAPRTSVPPTAIPTVPGSTPIPPTPGSSTCTSPNGCFFCSWATINCYWSSANDSKTCTGGYVAGPQSSCAALTSQGSSACERTAIPCSTDVRQYYCSVSSGCNLCPVAGCPTGVPAYANRATCTTTCNAPPTPKVDLSFQCTTGGNVGSGVSTAIGCIPYDLKPFITTALKWGIGLAGGIVMIVLGLAAITITTAGGDAKKVKAGQEMITAAIGGVILIVFSVLILNFIGVKILNIGWLGFSI